MTTTTLDDARAVKGRALEVFGPLAEVVGIGITRIGEGYGLKINLRRPPAPGVNLPEEVDGVPVNVEVVGTIRKR
ncbi:MAG: hypothetical protein JWL69_1728 [Phycisphaerales bacterium]|nr:hypothetical protein [Phycisphaerales bacterium]